MASLKEIKARISSIRGTLKITSAMKLVASNKFQKFQSAMGNLLPYQASLHRILAGVMQDEEMLQVVRTMGLIKSTESFVFEDVDSHSLPEKSSSDRVAIVAFSSSSSLCGGYNNNIIKQFHKLTEALADRGYDKTDIDIYVLGRKIAEAVSKAGYTIEGDYSELQSRPDLAKTADFVHLLDQAYESGRFSHVILLYSHWESMSVQTPIYENFLPISLNEYLPAEGSDTEPIDYLIEPEPVELLRSLFPQVLLLKMYSVILDSLTAEHSARMLAMQIACENAEDLISSLTLAYNKGRQQAITSEILDISSSSAGENF